MELNIFTEEELNLLNYAYSKFDKYLSSDDFVLVHNDLHFDNIFYSNGKIKIIDFERSLYAPRDFELDILYRMIRKPWKFASEETKQYTNSSHYSNIMVYIEKYYKELIDIPNLMQRLAIYDIVYFLRQLIKYPIIEELKNDVILGVKIVALKDELTFDAIKTPLELMDFMNINMEYGWIDNQGNKHINSLNGFRENYRTSSLSEMLETGLGTCIEQAKMIKFFFVMFGVSSAVSGVRVLSTQLSKMALNKIPQKALTKIFWYPILKKTTNLVGVSLTKKTFAQVVSKVVPVVGGVISGGINFASMMSMANRLNDTLDKAVFNYSDEEFNADIEIISNTEESDDFNDDKISFSKRCLLK